MRTVPRGATDTSKPQRWGCGWTPWPTGSGETATTLPPLRLPQPILDLSPPLPLLFHIPSPPLRDVDKSHDE
jgi:hypothetical protein